MGEWASFFVQKQQEKEFFGVQKQKTLHCAKRGD
jgi:hypothetical protein